MIATAEKRKKNSGNGEMVRMVEMGSIAGVYEFFEGLTTFEKLAILLFYYTSVLNNVDSDGLLEMLDKSINAETTLGEEPMETEQLRGMLQGVLFITQSMNL